MLCKGLQGVGIDNLACVPVPRYTYRISIVLTKYSRIMSDEQRNLVHLAKSSAQSHLSTILSSPKLYLGTLRYGMDFVWGKLFIKMLCGSNSFQTQY